MSPDPLTVMTRKEAASVLKVSESTIRTLIRTGRLRAFRAGSQVRVTSSALAEYIAASSVVAPRPAAQGTTRRQSRPAPRPVGEPITYAQRLLAKR